MNYQYKLVGAPEKGNRRRGTKTGSERIAAALQEIVAQHAQEGWEYMRTDTLPVSEPRGLFGGRREVMRAVLVFRRGLRNREALRETFTADDAVETETAAAPYVARGERATPTFQARAAPAPSAPARGAPPRTPAAEPTAGMAPPPGPVREPAFRAAPEAALPEETPEPPQRAPFRSPYRDDPAPRSRLFDQGGERSSRAERDEPEVSAERQAPERNPRDLSDIREALRKLDR
ncbi:MAG: hypothetical protein AAF371_00075 [Pseudomonadota bacterium]